MANVKPLRNFAIQKCWTDCSFINLTRHVNHPASGMYCGVKLCSTLTQVIYTNQQNSNMKKFFTLALLFTMSLSVLAGKVSEQQALQKAFFAKNPQEHGTMLMEAFGKEIQIKCFGCNCLDELGQPVEPSVNLFVKVTKNCLCDFKLNQSCWRNIILVNNCLDFIQIAFFRHV